MKPLEVREKVRLKKVTEIWIQAKVLSKTEFPQSVIVQTNEGKCYRINYHHLNRTKANIPSTQSMESLQPTQNNQLQEQKEESNVSFRDQTKTTRSGRKIKPVE